MKRGVFLLNFGGPDTLSDVKPYLFRLFSDPHILVGIPNPIRIGLAFLISRIKAPSSRRMYERIGGCSPQLKWTQRQMELLDQKLKKTNDNVKVLLGMKSWPPDIETALRAFKDWNADELVLLPLFPQFSTTTTGACLDDVFQTLRRMKWCPRIRTKTSWCDHKPFTDLLGNLIQTQIDLLPQEATEKNTHIVFSAHSLPMKIVNRGDPYPTEVHRTVATLARCISLPWSLAYQSKNGPIPWLKPYTDSHILELARHGCKHLIVVPISFVSDHIETLYELDIEISEQAQKAGIQTFLRVPLFNDDPRFIHVLSSLVEQSQEIDP